MKWRVVATRQGQFNQQIYDVGEVFDLLCYANGDYPHAEQLVKGKEADEIYEDVLMADKKTPQHRDYAEDFGPKLATRGPKKGEVVHLGWMLLVPASTPIGQYPTKDGVCHVDFWSKNVQLPSPVQVRPYTAGERFAEDSRRNHARILDVLPTPPAQAA